jgi:hypothetical protein
MSHALRHAPQLLAVDSDVSQPSTSGAEGLQSPQPGWQPLYWHAMPPSADATHVAPMLWVVSHTLSHAPQLVIEVVELSHPFVFGGVVLQSCQPLAQSR